MIDDELPFPARMTGRERRAAVAAARQRLAPRKAPVGRVRKAYASKGDDATLSRWVKVAKPEPPQLSMLDGPRVVSPRLLNKPYVLQGRTKFPKSVQDPAEAPHVLVSGHSNAKIGRDVRKGQLRGFWIYTLSLEERATCPRACHHWATCYGNNMPYASRFSHRDAPALMAAIAADVERLLSVRGRVGILVRLHALGDFFSPEYVNFWSELVGRYAGLQVFGYTAWAPGSAIGQAIAAAKARHGRRFAVRWSNGGRDRDCTVPIRAVDEPVNAIVCPEQTGRTAACATCALCWSTDRNIAFIEH